MKSILFLALIIGAAIFSVVAYKNTSKADSMPTVSENNIVVQHDSEKLASRKAVIVELFTSEGCSSCPPADHNLSVFQKEQPFKDVEIIALSEHVDYWNQGGWADPFSSSQFSSRQGEYSQYFGQKGNVYTPQMIVDGNREFVGGNTNAAQNAVTEAAKQPKGDLTIELGKIENNFAKVNVKIENLPKITNGDNAIILLAVTENNLASSVARGENAGRKLAHTAVVRVLQNAGSITNETNNIASTIEIGKKLKLENVKIVAFVQETGSRKILGASSVAFK